MTVRRVVDFAIVFAAALSALFVFDWYAHRQEVRQSEPDIEQLRSELGEERWISAYTLSYYNDVLANAKLAAQELEGEGALSDEAFLIAAYRASQYTWWNRRRAAYDALMATGGVAYMKERGTRRIASYIYNASLLDDIADRGAYSPYRDAFRMTVPGDVQEALGAACGDAPVSVGDDAGIERILSYDCSPGLPDETVKSTAALLRSDNALLPVLRLRIATLETQLFDLAEYNKIVQGLPPSD